jgi:hypothetical protein
MTETRSTTRGSVSVPLGSLACALLIAVLAAFGFYAVFNAAAQGIL